MTLIVRLNKVDGLDITYVARVDRRGRRRGNRLFPESIFPAPIKTYIAEIMFSPF